MADFIPVEQGCSNLRVLRASLRAKLPRHLILTTLDTVLRIPTGQIVVRESQARIVSNMFHKYGKFWT